MKKNKNQFLKLFKNKNFSKYMLGQLISKSGDTVFMIGLLWLILDRTKSPKLMGVVLFFTYLPQFALGLIAGSIVDQFDRRKIMIICDIVRGVVLFIFCIMIELKIFSIYLVIILTFLLASASVFFGPASQAFIPNIVQKDLLVSANAANSGIDQLCKIIGNAIAGIIIATIGVYPLFMFDGSSFLFSALMLYLIKYIVKNNKFEDVDNKISISKIVSDSKMGINFTLKDKFIKTFIILLVISNISYSIVTTLTPVFSERVLKAGPKGYGYLEAVLSVGMLLGISFIGSIKVKKVGYMFIFGIICSGVSLILVGLNSKLIIVMFLYLLFGLSDAFTAPMFAYFRLYVKDEIRGRVFSVFNLIVLSAVPISMATIGVLMEYFGTKNLYICCGVVLIISSVLAGFSRNFINASLENV